ncbi:hypothetical protein B0H17DRAFT_1339240 [Mycena rosella]|uniref:Uncharacterized protein n=1 Tax=Mycena rosella TaxID=1033263 RepID=A0AAD7C6U0_MYCRO|nr:hypothetical protein B0H17DRAFT_1339240 [Mycena rosella]
MSSMLALLRLRAPRLALRALAARPLHGWAHDPQRRPAVPYLPEVCVSRREMRRKKQVRATETTRTRRPPRGAREEGLHGAEGHERKHCPSPDPARIEALKTAPIKWRVFDSLLVPALHVLIAAILPVTIHCAPKLRRPARRDSPLYSPAEDARLHSAAADSRESCKARSCVQYTPSTSSSLPAFHRPVRPSTALNAQAAAYHGSELSHSSGVATCSDDSGAPEQAVRAANLERAFARAGAGQVPSSDDCGTPFAFAPQAVAESAEAGSCAS